MIKLQTTLKIQLKLIWESYCLVLSYKSGYLPCVINLKSCMVFFIPHITYDSIRSHKWDTLVCVPFVNLSATGGRFCRPRRTQWDVPMVWKRQKSRMSYDVTKYSTDSTAVRFGGGSGTTELLQWPPGKRMEPTPGLHMWLLSVSCDLSGVNRRIPYWIRKPKFFYFR